MFFLIPFKTAVFSDWGVLASGSIPPKTKPNSAVEITSI